MLDAATMAWMLRKPHPFYPLSLRHFRVLCRVKLLCGSSEDCTQAPRNVVGFVDEPGLLLEVSADSWCKGGGVCEQPAAVLGRSSSQGLINHLSGSLPDLRAPEFGLGFGSWQFAMASSG